MNPAGPTQDNNFGFSVEVMLLILGAIMTIAMAAIGLALVRVMRREDRERERSDGGDA